MKNKHSRDKDYNRNDHKQTSSNKLHNPSNRESDDADFVKMADAVSMRYTSLSAASILFNKIDIHSNSKEDVTYLVDAEVCFNSEMRAYQPPQMMPRVDIRRNLDIARDSRDFVWHDGRRSTDEIYS